MTSAVEEGDVRIQCLGIKNGKEKFKGRLDSLVPSATQGSGRSGKFKTLDWQIEGHLVSFEDSVIKADKE